jgi:peptidoglycan-associated lipoprotein
MKTQKTHTLPLLALAATLFLPGCKNKDEPETTPPAVSGGAPSDDTSSDDETNKAQIHISPKIQELCGISSDKANFEFDSAKLSKGAKGVLDELATCFLTGPGVGKNLALVGHADPRGTEDYNFALGQKRASNVGKYLGGRGLKGDRVESSSRGELDATGSSEPGWAQDRRVDILLAE